MTPRRDRPHVTPPKLGRRVLQWLLPDGESAEIMGDFEERFQTKVRERGAAAARIWHGIQILRLVPYLVKDHILWSCMMFKSHLRSACRQLARDKQSGVIVVVGLGVAFASGIAVAAYAIHEKRFERTHANHDRIFRISYESYSHATKAMSARGAAPLGLLARQSLPEIQNVARFWCVERPQVLMNGEWREEPKIFFADSGFLEVFTIPLLRGRSASALGNPSSLIIDEALAVKLFPGADPVGQIVRLNIEGAPHDFNVTGVMKNMPSNTTLQTSLLASSWPRYRDAGIDWNSSSYTYLLLYPGADPKDVENKIVNLYQNSSRRQRPATPFLQKLENVYKDAVAYDIRNDLKLTANPTLIFLLLVIAGMLLLFAVINYVNLNTAKLLGRLKEVAVRKTCGAGFGKLFSQFLVESMLLTALAMALGLALYFGFKAELESYLGRELTINLLSNHPVLLIVLGLIAAVGLLGGILPALCLPRLKTANLLKSDFGTRPGRNILRQALIMVQYAFTIGMIGFVLVLAKQVHYMKTADLGYDKNDLLVLRVHDAKKIAPLYSEMKNISSLKAASRSRLFFAGPERLGGSIKIAGVENDQEQFVQKVRTDAAFLPTFGIPLVAGRNFQPGRPADEKTIILNETAVRRFEIRDPVGKQIYVDGEPYEVIGVVRDFHTASLHSKIDPTIILNNESKDWYNYIVLRYDRRQLQQILIQVEAAWKSVLPEESFRYEFSDVLIQRDYRDDERLFEFLIIICGLVVLVACLGVYGLAAHNAKKRTKEVGIRKVLGASVPNILILLSKDSLVAVIAANVFAWPLTLTAAKIFLRNFSYRASFGVLEFSLSSAIALVLAFTTTSLQIFRAAHSDPAKALKYE